MLPKSPPLTTRPQLREDHGLILPPGSEVHSFKINRHRIDVYQRCRNTIWRGPEKTPIEIPKLPTWSYTIQGMMSGLGGSFEHACFQAEDMVRRDKDMPMRHINAMSPDQVARMECRLLADSLACMTAFPPDFDPARNDVAAARETYVELRDEMVRFADTAALDEVHQASARFRERFEAILLDNRAPEVEEPAEAPTR